MSQTLLERIRRAKESGDWSAVTEAIPYARFVGIAFEVAEPSGAGGGPERRCKMTFAERLIGNPSLPALHGGTIGALCESAAIFEVLHESETAILPKTINVTVDYLRPGKPVDTYAKGIVTKHGKRVMNVRVEAWQEDRARPIAVAYAHLLVRD